METLIKSIEELQKYVKINKSTDFETYQQFLIDAQDKYITPYIGQSLIDKLITETADKLRSHICRALGPFSLALATDEFSINVGESGHTVTRTEKLAPASDAKIAKATESLFNRGWSNLDNALRYLQSNIANYPEWKDVSISISTRLFDNATEFQEKGLVDIDNSPLTFHHLRMLVLRIETSETFKLLPDDMKNNFDKSASEDITTSMQAYTGSRVAALHTSQSTKTQRTSGAQSQIEFKPIIRPLYSDMQYTGNYFDEQADFWRNTLDEALIAAEKKEAGEGTVKYNSSERRIFVATATRS
ncbi:MAG: hypothetical protein PHG06_17820 [Parabacteroides sp.]|nr:hypothetical protein [Parabacteroides sp.]